MKKILLAVCLLFVGSNLVAQNATYQWKTATAGGYTYKYVTNDPSKTRFYTLKNGLTVILSPNYKEPKIEYRMSVRAGSNTDPKNATGLAHYLEHLLFKGTDKFGTANWAKEKPLLDKIDALYEKYNKTTDPAQRKEIYKEIDKVSGEASNFSIANEYDKMMQGIGGNSTNAHTWYEETVYNEDFPSNAVDKFLAIQAERFRKPIFRIFHTELEAVYEEKNRGLDNDGWKLDEAMMDKLFPVHNYGQQTTIGTIEHLKNPSLIEIRNYYNKYYVPNNMALILAGDLNPDEMIKKVDKAFSYMVPKPLSLYNPAPEKPLTKIQKVDVYGPSAEVLEVYYRGFAENSKESLMLSLIRSILTNGKAGLFDINLNKQQKVLRANATYQQMKDYGVFNLSAQPKQGQSLDDVAKLLLEQIQLLKEGKFDEELLKAIVANRKLSFLQAFDSNGNRAESLSTVFIMNRGTGWDRDLNETNEIAKITKAQVVAFANSFFKDNYVIGYKHKGEDKNTIKVDKPAITPINANAGLTSPFVKDLLASPVKPIAPKFLDYQKDITFGKSGLAEVLTIKNTENSIFRMTYRFNMGSNNYKLLQYAATYLPYLGTDKYTAEELSKEFYNIACSYSLNVGSETTTISVSGLQENFDKAVALVEHIFANVKANEKALGELKNSILKSRENSKLNKGAIMNGLTSYAQYGKLNPFNNVLTNDEVKNIKADDLIYLLKNLNNYEHVVTYYGPKDLAAFTADIQKAHALPKEFTPAAPAKVYTYTVQDSNKVYFANYDMVQSEIRWLRNTGLYNKNDGATIEVFNNYFGGGMGSVVFQTIRESKALAYSTYASYISPDKADKEYSMIAYVGSQADKMNEAVAGMNELLNVLPKSEKTFDGAKANLLSSYESDRILKDAIFGRYFADKKLGYTYDSRIDRYKEIKPITFETINTFHQQKIANKPYTYLIVASDKRVKQEDMAKFGNVKTLTLEEIFGY
ncbi:M16 family metallopeptidase [Pedobacter chitinilyticus]|uniref:Insulinase family protein n=1 Tax=Pedobacter chitinilyticus TaxID=2233776 RepID=A0A443YX34_9SPHI|nr:M16 family metallopeptidase [Pedobacter chitinilyticus]RWU08527.1 insulinase family protein [Pedobacter chitinilyticus]